MDGAPVFLRMKARISGMSSGVMGRIFNLGIRVWVRQVRIVGRKVRTDTVWLGSVGVLHFVQDDGKNKQRLGRRQKQTTAGMTAKTNNGNNNSLWFARSTSHP